MKQYSVNGWTINSENELTIVSNILPNGIDGAQITVFEDILIQDTKLLRNKISDIYSKECVVEVLLSDSFNVCSVPHQRPNYDVHVNKAAKEITITKKKPFKMVL